MKPTLFDPAFQALPFVRQHLKSILTGDWQPRLEVPADLVNLKAMLDDIQAYHPDVDDMVHVGDITERASAGQTGDLNGVISHRQVLTEFWNRTAIPRVFWMSGNHDSDGKGWRQHEKFWAPRSYEDYIGRHNYYVRRGNLLRIFLSDMTGASASEMTLDVAYWFDQIVKRHKGCNIEVYIHAPLYGGYGSYAENSDFVQRTVHAQNIIQTLNEADNIAFVASGHVGRPEALPNAVTAYGTTHFSINMHIPGASTFGVMPYAILEYDRGETAATIRLWDAASHTYFPAEHDIPITYRYPLDLGGEGLDFDGRNQLGNIQPYVRGAMTMRRDLSEDRVNNGTELSPQWESVVGLRTFMRFVLSETANDDASVGDGISQDFWLPGSIPGDAEGSDPDVVLRIGGNYLAGRTAFIKATEPDNEYSADFSVELSPGPSGAGSLREIFRLLSTGQARLPYGALANALPDLGTVLAVGLDNTLLDKGPVASSANLNSFTEPGIYRVLNSTVAATLSNCPYTTSGGVLLVLSSASPAAARPVAAADQMQIYIARAVSDGPRIYTRVCNAGAWPAGWRIIMHSGLVQTSVSAAPEFIGQTAVVGGVGYMATGTSSSADWKQVTA